MHITMKEWMELLSLAVDAIVQILKDWLTKVIQPATA